MFELDEFFIKNCEVYTGVFLGAFFFGGALCAERQAVQNNIKTERQGVQINIKALRQGVQNNIKALRQSVSNVIKTERQGITNIIKTERQSVSNIIKTERLQGVQNNITTERQCSKYYHNRETVFQILSQQRDRYKDSFET